MFFNLFISAWRLLSRVCFACALVFALPFLFLFVIVSRSFILFYRVCGSGARGLIKAPAGSGAGPGCLPDRLSGFVFYSLFGPLSGKRGGRGRVWYKFLLDLLVPTDTEGVSFWGCYGVR